MVWGTNGTGKTIVLVQCLQIKNSILKLEGKKTKIHIVVYHPLIKEGSQLLKDMKNKYIPSMHVTNEVELKTFRQICEGWMTFF